MARSHRSDSTASSASEGGRGGRSTYEMAYRDAPLTATTSKSAAAYRFRDDSEEALQGLEDVEEEVGLLQRDRQRHRGVSDGIAASS